MRVPSLSDKYSFLPSVDSVLHCEGAGELISECGRELVVYAVRQTIEQFRKKSDKKELEKKEKTAPEEVFVIAARLARSLASASLRRVINATGIILHTNLGRAPLGEKILQELTPIIRGYSNLEFDLDKAERGHRMSHISRLLACLTGAQDALVVNNNAAAIILVLHTLANNRDVIISRGELIEIGGAFRIPDIMAASGARMVEVGTTNRTRASDYEQAISPQTALLFKAHKSNYTIAGFTEEVSISELARLAHAHRLPLLYDIGSGLLRKLKIPGLIDEPDVGSALSDGADLVCFSGDKLLGGPQSGIIVGKKELIGKLAKAPLMRALRVGKLTIAALSSACRSYLRKTDLEKDNPVFVFISRSAEKRRELAERLSVALHNRGVASEIVSSTVQCGGGSLPELRLDGFAVALVAPEGSAKEKASFAEKKFRKLLLSDPPVLGILREGKLLFDTGALFEEDIEPLAGVIGRICNEDGG